MSLESMPDRLEIPAAPEGVELFTLQNGLTIIVKEDHSAPVVSAQAWCCAGSVDEGKWLGAGLSHMLEHMLFKGTESRGSVAIEQAIQDAGGYMNAYTSFDRTVYWINVPNDGATVAIDVLCDIMQNATLPEEELEKEKQVILREMDMNQDDPGRRASRRLFETVYTRSPYRNTVIGYPEIFNQLTRADVLEYYHGKYVPKNMFFVVVGDFQASTVVEQISAAFAHARSKALPAVVLPSEPRQMAPRELVEELAIEQGYVHIAWHIPDIHHPDIPALDVLSTLLGGGRSARLFQRIRQTQGLVNSIDAWTYSPGNPGIFGMTAVVDAPKFEAARSAMLREIERLQNEIVPPDELLKVVKQFTASTLAIRKTMQGQAQDLGGSWMVARDLNFSERFLQSVKEVTSADLQRVARTYLTPGNRTVYALLPLRPAQPGSRKESAAVEHPIERYQLPNGLTILIKEDHRLPFVECRVVFKGGLLSENSGNHGVTQLMSRLWMQGTRNRTGEQLSLEIEAVGGSLDTFSGNNSFGASLEVLSDDLHVGLTLLADLILNPLFPENEFERERSIQWSQLKSQQDQMMTVASRAMRHALFGESTFGLDPLGSDSSLEALDTAALRQHYERMAVPNNAVCSLFGDVKSEELRKTLEVMFGGWKRAEVAWPVFPALKRPDSIIRLEEIRDKKQAVLIFGFCGIDFFCEDRYALEMLQEACSDMGSRLFTRIREKLGLAYYVGAGHLLGLAPGYFSFYVGTAPEKVALVEAELRSEIDLLRREGLTAEELKRSKAKIVGQKKIARQDLGSLATTAALDELYGLGFGFSDQENQKLEAVTLKDVDAAIHKYLTPENFVIAIARPPAG